jgi:hypothetical protein
MTTNIAQYKTVEQDSREVTIDLEFENYLFEVFLNDRIESEILRMMEYCGEKPSNRKTPLILRVPKSNLI